MRVDGARGPCIGPALALALSLGAAHTAGCGTGDAPSAPAPASSVPEAGDPLGDDAGSVDDAAPPAPDAAPPADAGFDAGPFVQAPHRPFPQIPPLGRHQLAPARVVSIFTPTETLVPDLTTFGDDLVASSWWKTVGKDYGLTTATHVAVQATAAIPASPTQSQLAAYVDAVVTGHPAVADDGHTIYLLYLPDGVVDSGNTNCAKHGGYHTLSNAGHVWGVAMRCPTTGTNLSKLESLTVIASHEIIEAATDPLVSTPSWTLGFLQGTSSSPWTSTEGEVGDMCVATIGFEGSWTLQRVWSNTAAAAGGDPCVPAIKAPYFNVSVDKDWYSVPAGGSLDIPLAGWSTARMPKDWIVDAVQIAGSDTFTPSITSPTSLTVNTKKFPSLNNGATATLTVKAPATAGAYAVVWVLSEEVPPGASSDEYHFWPVGLYVP